MFPGQFKMSKSQYRINSKVQVPNKREHGSEKGSNSQKLACLGLAMGHLEVIVVGLFSGGIRLGCLSNCSAPSPACFRGARGGCDGCMRSRALPRRCNGTPRLLDTAAHKMSTGFNAKSERKNIYIYIYALGSSYTYIDSVNTKTQCKS
jgi:hypothetical protein